MNRSKAKGTGWETALVDYLHDLGFPDVERRTLAGANDRGDIAGLRSVVVEAKAEKDYSLAGWLKEAIVERDNAGAWLGVVWAKARGKTRPADGFVIMSGEQFGVLLKVLAKKGVL